MEKKIKIGYIINIVFGGLITVGALLFMLLHKSVSSYIVKTIPSVLFLLAGCFNLIYCIKVLKLDNCKKFAFTLVLGLFFAMLGDILLIDFFIVGAILFAIGHILFFVSFCFINKFNVKDIIVGAIIFALALLFILLYPNFTFDGMLPLIIIYALIISLMLGKAVSNFIFNKSITSIIILIGAGLFFFSDLMLLIFRFAHRFMIFDWLCVMTYYPAEFLLAFSIFFSFLSQSKKNKN